MQQPLAKKPTRRLSTSIDDGATSVSGPGAASAIRELVFAGLPSRQMLWAVQQQWGKLLGSEELTSRVSAHITIFILAILAVALSNVQWPWGGASAIRPLKQSPANPSTNVASVTKEKPIPFFNLPSALNQAPGDVLTRAAVPHTIIPERSRYEITTYNVQSGDTIYDIAIRLGLAPETIMWSNPHLEDNPDLLQVGQELTILPFDGLYHQVGSGDTLEGIASTFKTDVASIVNYEGNSLDPDNPTIQAGQWLVVPGGSKPFVPRTVTAYAGPIPGDALMGTGSFVWPASGAIYQGFWGGHPGIDVAAWEGAPVLAADAGYVVVAGWDNSGYGYHVVVDHGNGYQTLYAHLKAYFVDAGESVARGQEIGDMGSTGYSTGPHLHFEIRQGTVQRNPVGFLP